MKIVFIVGSLTDSHIIKRIESFLEKGYDVDVYGYSRDLNFTNKVNGVQPVVIGKLISSKYANRIIKGWKEISSVINKYPSDTLFYLWGFDVALVNLVRGTNYIYEESDIRYAEFARPLCYLFKLLDRIIIQKSIATFLTSEGFVKFIGGGCRVKKKLQLLPNKLSTKLLGNARPESYLKTEKIRIGYIGMYRYPNTVLRLARVIGESFHYMEFHFWGIGNEKITNEINEITTKYSNVYEHGPFKNPSDLAKVYDTIDVVACNYDTNGINERIAEPNKLYEAVFFNKPLIVSNGTFLAEKVEMNGWGVSLDSSTDENIVNMLCSLNHRVLNDIIQKLKSVSDLELFENYEKLWQTIDKYNNEKSMACK